MGYGYKELLSSIQYLHDFCKEHDDCDKCPFVKPDGVCCLTQKLPDEWEVEEWLG